jgi:O-antigen/teichoic acid export membrane protein
MARKATLNFFMKSLVTIFALFSFLYMGRVAEPGVVAMLAFALGFVGVFTFVSDLGFNSGHVKRISEGADEAKCNATFGAIKVALTALMVACTLATVLIWDFLYPEGAFSKAEQRWVVYVVLIYYSLFSLAQIPILTFSGRIESAKQQAPETIGTLVRVPLIIYAVLLGLGAVALAMSYVATGLVMLIVGVFLFRSYKYGSPDRETLGSYSRYAIPIIPLLMVTILSQNLPPVLIAYFTGSEVEVAGYFMLQRVTLVFILVSTSVSPVLFPKFSRDHAAKAMGSLKDTCVQSERLISMYMMPVVALAIALAPALIHIFLIKTYVEYSLALALLASYAFVVSIDATYISAIYGVDRPDINLRLGLVTAAVTIIGFFTLVPRTFFGLSLLGGGATGAAAALFIGGCVEYAVSRHYAKGVAGVSCYKRIWVHVGAGVATVAFLLLASHLSEAYLSLPLLEWRWFHLLAYSSAGLGLYFGILAAAREFTGRDLRLISDLLNVRKMLTYVSSEMREKR